MVFNIFQNLDLLFVGIAVAAISILSFVVLVNDRKSVTGRSFMFFSLITIFWSMLNYAQYQVHEVNLSFWILRGVIFFAVWHAFSFFQLALVFPRPDFKFPISYKFILIPLIIAASLLTLTPYVFLSVLEVSPLGQIAKVENGPGIAIFGLTVTLLILSGILILLIKAFRREGEEQEQLRFVLWGVFLTFALLLTFNFILPAFADNPSFILLGPVFLLPFAFFTFYAIYRHNLLNVKVVSTEIVAFFLLVVTFSEIMLSQTFSETIFRIVIFAALLLISLLLIKSVLEEVRVREKLAKLDQAKSEFISLAGHQLRAPLTAIKGYTSMILDGSFGAIQDRMGEILKRVLVSTEQLVKLVAELLDLSRIEAGRFKYEFAKINLNGVIEEVIKEVSGTAQKKNLSIEFKNETNGKTEVLADKDKMHEVIINFLDNAIKYSDAGTILVQLKTFPQNPSKLLFSISDNGIGIAKEDILKLFIKFGRTDEARKIRPEGMGLGLYFIKRIIEDHGGKVWVESPGLGKGSTFFVELPVA